MKNDIRKAILAIFCFFVINQAESIAQGFSWGLGAINHYSISFLPVKFTNNFPFEISDYKNFGKGIENGEGRMLFEPVNEEVDRNLFNISVISFFFAYNKFQFEIISNGYQNFNLSYLLFGNKKISTGLSIGYGRSNLFNNELLNTSYVYGTFHPSENYLYPVYNGDNYLLEPGDQFALQKNGQNLYSAGILVNFSLGKNHRARKKKEKFRLFSKLSVVYTNSNLNYEISDNYSLLIPGTYQEFVPNLKVDTYLLFCTVGYYFYYRK